MIQNEQRQKEHETWEQACRAFQSRVDGLTEISRGCKSIVVVGGEVDQLDTGYAASLIFEVRGAVLCITAHSLYLENAQTLVYQTVAQWLKFMQADYE